MREGTGTILLAEDNEADAGLLISAFESWGVRNPISVVKDGNEAVAYLLGAEKYQDRYEFPMPSLILLDVHMAHLGGFGTLDWIRKRSEYDHIPVILLTGTPQPIDVEKAYLMGANSFLIKTQKLDEFRRRIEEINVFVLQARFPYARLCYNF
ncbi:response regulator [Pedosphaera parvula]|uniref:Response regulator receiver protein n=1 Tax=Pedosphaera parvula (strain Ellin514) TaxID=320771 RepID=B9XPQ3_PEDPL|nr:response regulator [Pedosphaera parvula]EEF58176.1 response regulator receiver protein [Pedosphaera parvula Ellin514]